LLAVTEPTQAIGAFVLLTVLIVTMWSFAVTRRR
jgi:hypothetical protein